MPKEEVIYNPKISKIIGANEYIVLLTLHSISMGNKRESVNIDGRCWTRIPSTDLEEYMPLCNKTIRVALKNLECRKLIESEMLSKHYYDKAKWYTILYENIPQIEEE